MPPPPLPPTGRFSRWPWWRRWFGRRSERAAARFLHSLGWRIFAANVADTAGELDLIAIERDTLVIVEVRSTSGDDWERVAASVDFQKQKRITNAATRFLARKKLLEGVNVRYDVLVLCWPPSAKEPVIRHFPNAFETVGRFQFHS
jgi:putative endonuclease